MNMAKHFAGLPDHLQPTGGRDALSNIPSETTFAYSWMPEAIREIEERAKNSLQTTHLMTPDKHTVYKEILEIINRHRGSNA